MTSKVRSVLLRLAGVLPGNTARRLALSLVPGYQVARDACVGWATLVDVTTLKVERGAVIGSRARCVGPIHVVMRQHSTLGPECVVSCGEWACSPPDDAPPYARRFELGVDAVVTGHSFFDAVGSISIGEGSWLAGRDTQVWTHGLGEQERDVSIGRYCYVASAVRFAPGARLGDLTVVALGAVVLGSISDTRQALVAGVPAVVVKSPYRAMGFSSAERAIAEGRIAWSDEV